jgi:amino acid transporter
MMAGYQLLRENKLMKDIYRNMLMACFLGFFSSMAHAYVGPGAGLSAIGTVIAFVGAIFLLIMGFLWYPIKRLLKRKKANSSQSFGNENIDPGTTVEKQKKHSP